MASSGSDSGSGSDFEGASSLFRGGGAFVLLLGAPRGASVGLDGAEWAVADAFRGFRGVPPRGVHLLTSAAAEGAGGAAGAAPRVAEVLCLAPGEVAVRRWDAADECFGVAAPAGSAEAEDDARLAAAAARGEFDGATAAYEAGRWRAWRGLTARVTPAACARAGARVGFRLHAGDWDAMGLGGEAASEAALVPAAATDLRCVTFPASAAWLRGARARRSHEGGAGVPGAAAGELGAALTRLATDGGARLEAALTGGYGGDEAALLAELQLSFVLFVFGAQAAPLAQWQGALALLGGAAGGGGAARRPALYAGACGVLRAQLRHVPADFFFEGGMASGGAVEGALAELVGASELEGWAQGRARGEAAPGGCAGGDHERLRAAAARLREAALRRFGAPLAAAVRAVAEREAREARADDGEALAAMLQEDGEWGGDEGAAPAVVSIAELEAAGICL